MKITKYQIHEKKQELGLEPPHPTHGPGHTESAKIVAEQQAMATESEQAELTENDQHRRQFVGTNTMNQYR